MAYYHPEVTYFAKTNFRANGKPFGIYQHDRFSHFYILGRTGTGKTTLLHTKISQDIAQGNGICLLDIHGDLVNKVVSEIPPSRKNDVVYMDAGNPTLTLGYNPLRKVSYEKRSLVASNILEVFQRLWGTQAWGIKMAHILRNVLLTLLDQPQANFSDVLKILHDSQFRNQCLPHIVNEEVKAFWYKEFKTYTKNDLVAIYNKIGGFLTHPAIRRIVIENKEQISIRHIMDKQKILLINLSKGVLGIDASYIFTHGRHPCRTICLYNFPCCRVFPPDTLMCCQKLPSNNLFTKTSKIFLTFEIRLLKKKCKIKLHIILI